MVTIAPRLTIDDFEQFHSEEAYVYSEHGQRILSGKDLLASPGFSITVEDLFRLGQS